MIFNAIVLLKKIIITKYLEKNFRTQLCFGYGSIVYERLTALDCKL